MKRSILRYLLTMFTAVLLLSLAIACRSEAIPSASAATVNGTADNITWTFDTQTGILYVNGTGDMGDYYYILSPWMEYAYAIKEAYISDGITSVGNSAFASCFNMTKISIPASVTKIEQNAFTNCVALTDIIMHDNITSIGDNAFSMCVALQTLALPASLTSIGNTAFRFCESLTDITLPAGLTSIGDYAFDSTGVTDVVIPDSITNLGNGVFFNCLQLKNLTMPVSLTYTTNTFAYCPAIEKVTLTAGNGTMPEYTTNSYDTSAIYYQNTPWYQSGDSFKTLVIADGVKNISKYAFYYNEALENVTIADSVTTVGDYAFYNCTALTELHLGNGVESIGTNAISYCSSLKTLTIPVSAITTWAIFDETEGIENLTFLKGTGTMPDFSVQPHKYTSMPWYQTLKTLIIADGITNISDCAFVDNASLTSLTIGNSVETIGSNAFKNCSALTSLIIPDSVTSIGEYAFYNCKGITALTLPDAITKVEESTFRDTGITTLTLGANTKEIATNAFYNCAELTQLTVNPALESVGKDAFLNTDKLGKVYINDLAAWCNIAFANQDANPFHNTTSPTEQNKELYLNGELVTDLLIPDSVTAIKSYVFAFYTFRSVYVPASLESIEQFAFWDSATTECIHISNLTAWCKMDGPDTLTNMCGELYLNGTLLTEVTVPDSITEIKDGAFKNCTNLVRVNIPDSVVSIGADAFLNCSGIKELSFPVSAVFDSNTFTNCTNIETITLTKGTGTMITFRGPNSTSWVTGPTSGNAPWGVSEKNPTIILEEGVANISSHAFRGCTFETIRIPDSVTSIGSESFKSCVTLTSIDIGAGCVEIGESAFYNCSNLQTVFFGKALEEIGQSAFSGAGSIDVVFYGGTQEAADDIIFRTFNNSVDPSRGVRWIYNYSDATHTFVDDVLFSKTKTLLVYYPVNDGKRFYAVPDGVRSIEQNAFAGADLYAVQLPEGLKNIGSNAFSRCYDLSAVYIPAGVVSIDEAAFFSCNSLTDVYFGGTQEQWNEIQIGSDNSCLKDATIHFNTTITADEKGVYNQDKTHLICWLNTKADQITVPASVTVIGANAFKNCAVSSFTFGNNIKTVSNNAFYGCTGLIAITLPDSIESLGNNAFCVCTNLVSIDLPANLRSIGNDCFGECENLKSVTLPKKLESIGNSAFYLCTALESVAFPPNLQSIGTQSFYGCSALSEVSLPASLTNLGSAAFKNCTGLTSFCLPNGLSAVANEVFYGCAKLEHIFIPSTISSFGDSAFYTCSALTDVFFGGSEEAWNDISITSSNSILYAVNVHFAHAHTYNDWTQNEAAGTQSRVCADCKFEEKQLIPGLCQHEWDAGVITLAATCKDTGIMTYTCSECKQTYTEDIPVDETKHEWADGVVTNAPTTEAEGEIIFTCAVCKNTKTESIPPIRVPAFAYGDADGDGEVTSADARLALRASVGLDTLSEAAAEAADADGDGKVSSNDARFILRYAVGLETDFPKK